MTLALLGGSPSLRDPHHFSWPRMTPAHVAAVTGLVEQAELSYYGREGQVAVLEDEWSRRLGRPTLAVTSGTAALHSAFFALGAGPGDEVICPTNTFLATVMPLAQTGARIVLADVEEDTGNIDPRHVEQLVNERTVGVVATHLWGHPCSMDLLQAVVERHGLWLVEDCSHAHGSTFRGQEVGTFGDAAAFSFQSAKLVFAGQGGLLASREAVTHERAVLLGHFRVRAAQDCRSDLARYASTGFGLNYRMHPLAAALAHVSTLQMDELIAMRHERLSRLSQLLGQIPGLVPPVTRDQCTRGAFYGYKLRLQGRWLLPPRDLVVDALRAEGLDVGRPGSAPLHTTAFFTDDDVPVFINREASHARYRPGELPVSERIWDESLSLPTLTFPEDESLVDAYAAAFAKVYGELGALVAKSA
ncbi:DegT/DnrJ/EryC1/StrS family aminotransferase [Blastococcus sp. TF02-8]|uniref:DegT/DnrJ/EryC1/StrS family aminotransferase n=1 Tax=Blastococcus sp. TF02-8 TaxID=2250574 RepID=UPI000DE8E00D|nr:DegT/DnrJ/EryC1/StrS family aminotransferase [Blastococcus sp. TF02-8]RBY95901.1 DegT/DnrJ/EryC1/StrS family aminotransferase [Blastococcus sp. TF02-8]